MGASTVHTFQDHDRYYLNLKQDSWQFLFGGLSHTVKNNISLNRSQKSEHLYLGLKWSQERIDILRMLRV